MTRLLVLALGVIVMGGCGILDRREFPTNCKLERYAGEHNDVVIPCRIQERTTERMAP